MKENEQAVDYYVQARGVLQQHAEIPSFKSIATDCDVVMNALRKRLRENIGAEVNLFCCCFRTHTETMFSLCLHCVCRMHKRRVKL